MNKKLFLTTALTIMALSAPMAHAADATSTTKSTYDNKDNGGYEATTTTKTKAEDGTVSKIDQSADLSVDDDGDATKKTESTAVTDPDGLMNKSVKKSETQMEDKQKDGYSYTQKTVQKNADGTNIKTKADVDVKIDANGNETQTIKTTKVTDPKGLMNSTTKTNQKKVVNGVVVEDKTDTD